MNNLSADEVSIITLIIENEGLSEQRVAELLEDCSKEAHEVVRAFRNNIPNPTADYLRAWKRENYGG